MSYATNKGLLYAAISRWYKSSSLYWQDMARDRLPPNEAPCDMSFYNWFQRTIAKAYKPVPAGPAANAYDIMARDNMARYGIDKLLTQDCNKNMWTFLTNIHMNTGSDDITIELLTEYLMQNPTTKAHIMRDMHPENCHLVNPYGLPDIEYVLTKPRWEQIGFLLEDSLPYDGHEEHILCQPKAAINKETGVIQNIISETAASLKHLVTPKDTTDDILQQLELQKYNPYILITRHCFQPFQWTVSIPLSDITHSYDKIRKKMQSLLRKKEIYATTRDLSQYLGTDFTVLQVTFCISFGSTEKTIDGWLYSRKGLYT